MLENDVSKKLIFMKSLQFPFELGGLEFSFLLHAVAFELRHKNLLFTGVGCQLSAYTETENNTLFFMCDPRGQFSLKQTTSYISV